MKDAQKPDHVNLNTLIARLREGRYVIPDFQREFEWKPSDIRELLRSIFLDYYIGSLLLWKGKPENFKALSCEAIYGFAGDGRPEYIVLDGQQRLTALYYSFLAPDKKLPTRRNRYAFFIRVDKLASEEYDLAFNYDRWTRAWAARLKEVKSQYLEHIFPLSVVGAEGWALPNWVQGCEAFWRERAANAANEVEKSAAVLNADNAKNFGVLVQEITQQYRISYIELDKDLEVDKVCDIFTQINSRGVQLDIFDLVNALLRPQGLQLKTMWRDSQPRLSFVDTEKMNVYVLQVMSILRQAYCSPKYLYYLLPGHEKQVRDPDGTRRKEILISDTGQFKSYWNEAVGALETAIKLLRHPQEFGVTSSNYLPYVSILPVFAALQAQVKQLVSSAQLDAQRKIRHWYWASVFTNRYSGSVESTSARDFLDVKAWLSDDVSEPALLDEFKTRFRNLDLRGEVKRGSSVYNGVFNLLVIQGARDWMTGNIPQVGDLDDHHIVPASWGEKNLKGNLINTILNRTPLTADTNRNLINDRLPNEYLPELIRANDERAVRAVLESHFISPAAQAILMRDPFTPADFEEFIADRQRGLQDAIENLLIKERLDLPPQLRELDARIEKMELALRTTVDTALEGHGSSLPPHIVQQIDERVSRASKKNAAMDVEHYKTLSGKLEYCDLRELQDIILSKALWSRFESKFANKETLSAKFGQLAELRNGIRHSRNVDEITAKEGEAAILWFEKVL